MSDFVSTLATGRGAALSHGSSIGFLAGGSREEPKIFVSIHENGLQNMGRGFLTVLDLTTARWVILGSRLLPAYRAAQLQSGSPPCAGPRDKIRHVLYGAMFTVVESLS